MRPIAKDFPPVHDALCEICGAVFPCEEVECTAPALHAATCPDCLRAVRAHVAADEFHIKYRIEKRKDNDDKND